jgi:hypothetical protein
MYNRAEVVQNKSSLLLKINLQNTLTLQHYNQYVIRNYLHKIFKCRVERLGFSQGTLKGEVSLYC